MSDMLNFSSQAFSSLNAELRQSSVEYCFAYRNHISRPGVLHRHDCWELVFHVKGEGCIEYDKDKEMFCAGSWSLTAPGVSHKQSNSPGDEDICLTFSTRNFVPPPRLHGTVAANRHLFSAVGEIVRLAENGSMRDGFWRQQELNARTLLILSVFMQALEKSYADEPRNAERYAKQAETLIRKNGCTALTLSEIAGILRISPDYLRHCWKKTRGIPLKDFQLTVRLEYALNLLDYSEMTIKEIAFACGFHSASHFCAAFKNCHGFSPGSRRIHGN